MKNLFQLLPDMFNRVYIWRIRRPIKQWYTLISEPIFNLFGCVNTGVIVHECTIRLKANFHLIVKNFKIGVGGIAISSGLLIAGYYDQI